MSNYPRIKLHKGKDEALKRFHPWIFSGAIQSSSSELTDGDIVEVYSSLDNYLCTGFYHYGSIAIRIISFEKIAIDDEFWLRKLYRCYRYRESLLFPFVSNTNAYRLVFGEADYLPGLIIDYYKDNLIIQCHSIGMHRHLDSIVKSLQIVYENKIQCIYDKSAETLPKEYAKNIQNSALIGNAEQTEISEYGNHFLVNWVKGQKTGFFLDQRENRKLMAEYSKDKAVLNTFCYSGGFSVYAAKAGAKLVHSVDVSKHAIELTNQNMDLNNFSTHQSYVADTFDYLRGNKNQYDLIVLDPPAFTKSLNTKHNAVIGYKRINSEAIKQIKRGGILFTFSCSQVVEKSLFFNTVTSAAIEAKRKATVLHYLSQPSDHPINIHYPEGEYLKGMVLYIE